MASCSRPDYEPTAIVKDGAVVSVRDQKMAVMRNGRVVKTYPVSTSKFGLGDGKGSCRTPLGAHRIASKIGSGQPKGMVFKSRKPTGECVAPNSPGRDPIVTRIMWLEGLEPRNRNAHSRLIYIHGTAEERTIGTPASYGCVRMKSNDVYEAFNLLRTGDPVVIERCSIDASLKALAQAEKMQDSSLLVMSSVPDRLENANTASVISHRRRGFPPPCRCPFPQANGINRKEIRSRQEGGRPQDGWKFQNRRPFRHGNPLYTRVKTFLPSCLSGAPVSLPPDMAV
ncbi:L,D-transpeptidase family protein [uncultured Akkermansia sp.]|uniref:L,D-transpeptidase n=1 Tax=uncultured Akkermansia sp. TaxID=512294 RepID=UPI0027D95A37|nr:L,D-transpeptidase family protein [uncultured Akkermansia sp.]